MLQRTLHVPLRHTVCGFWSFCWRTVGPHRHPLEVKKNGNHRPLVLVPFFPSAQDLQCRNSFNWSAQQSFGQKKVRHSQVQKDTNYLTMPLSSRPRAAAYQLSVPITFPFSLLFAICSDLIPVQAFPQLNANTSPNLRHEILHESLHLSQQPHLLSCWAMLFILVTQYISSISISLIQNQKRPSWPVAPSWPSTDE